MVMKEIIDLIRCAIIECKEQGDMFHLPVIDRDDIIVEMQEHETIGSVLYSCEYRINMNNGGWIQIKYESKDKCRAFQVNPDRSYINISCSDPSLNFSDGWDEKV